MLSAVSMDRIADTGPAGHFFDDAAASDDASAREQSVVDQHSHDAWAENGRISAVESGYKRVLDLLEKYEPPPMASSTRDALEAYVDARPD